MAIPQRVPPGGGRIQRRAVQRGGGKARTVGPNLARSGPGELLAGYVPNERGPIRGSPRGLGPRSGRVARGTRGGPVTREARDRADTLWARRSVSQTRDPRAA